LVVGRSVDHPVVDGGVGGGAEVPGQAVALEALDAEFEDGVDVAEVDADGGLLMSWRRTRRKEPAAMGRLLLCRAVCTVID
jgi:hypothetical protein